MSGRPTRAWNPVICLIVRSGWPLSLSQCYIPYVGCCTGTDLYVTQGSFESVHVLLRVSSRFSQDSLLRDPSAANEEASAPKEVLASGLRLRRLLLLMLLSEVEAFVSVERSTILFSALLFSWLLRNKCLDRACLQCRCLPLCCCEWWWEWWLWWWPKLWVLFTIGAVIPSSLASGPAANNGGEWRRGDELGLLVADDDDVGESGTSMYLGQASSSSVLENTFRLKETKTTL